MEDLWLEISTGKATKWTMMIRSSWVLLTTLTIHSEGLLRAYKLFKRGARMVISIVNLKIKLKLGDFLTIKDKICISRDSLHTEEDSQATSSRLKTYGNHHILRITLQGKILKSDLEEAATIRIVTLWATSRLKTAGELSQGAPMDLKMIVKWVRPLQATSRMVSK